MASIPSSQAKADSQSAEDAIQSAADTRFITDVDNLIQAAIDQGVFFVNANAYERIDIQAISDHYTSLGYKIQYPDFPENQMLQPAALFGDIWVNFWSGGNAPSIKKRPLRLIISWE